MAEMMKERPAYVRFEKRAIEDRAASIASGGSIMTRDVVYALITPPGSKDIIPRIVETVRNSDGQIVEMGWLDYLDTQAAEGRVPQQFVDSYRAAYEKWKKGEEAPLSGTPIKDWPPLTPSQRTNLIAMNILTVEDLASLNEEGKARFGMGIVAMQQKAKNWLEAANSIGGVVMRLSTLEQDYKQLKEQNERQVKIIAELKGKIGELEKVPA